MGYEHKTVNSSKGEYVRDEDGDGFYEVHMKTTEGVWALLHYVVGYVHTGEFRRSTCRITSAFLNSFTPQGQEVTRYLKRCCGYSCRRSASQDEPKIKVE